MKIQTYKNLDFHNPDVENLFQVGLWPCENGYFEHKIAIFTGPKAHLKLILYIWIIKIQVLIGLNFHNISILTTRSHKKQDPWWIQKPKNCNFLQIYAPAQENTPYVKLYVRIWEGTTPLCTLGYTLWFMFSKIKVALGFSNEAGNSEQVLFYWQGPKNEVCPFKKQLL